MVLATGCTTVSLNSMRPGYPGDAKLDVMCAEYPGNQSDTLNAVLAAAYDEGFRLAAVGSSNTSYLFFSTGKVLVCLEAKAPVGPQLEVTCVNKKDNLAHQSITTLGGVGWRRTRQLVAHTIDTKANTYTIAGAPPGTFLGAVGDPSDRYVQGFADGKWVETLLLLPPCRF